MKVTGKIFIDTAPIIYHVEENKAYQRSTEYLFEVIDNDDQVVPISSRIVLSELLVIPYREQNTELSEKYLELMLPMIPDNIHSIAEKVARLRSINVSLKYPDAENIVTAMRENCHFFITNDKKLQRLTGLNNLKVITMDDIESSFDDV